MALDPLERFDLPYMTQTDVPKVTAERRIDPDSILCGAQCEGEPNGFGFIIPHTALSSYLRFDWEAGAWHGLGKLEALESMLKGGLEDKDVPLAKGVTIAAAQDLWRKEKLSPDQLRAIYILLTPESADVVLVGIDPKDSRECVMNEDEKKEWAKTRKMMAELKGMMDGMVSTLDPQARTSRKRRR